MSAWEGANVAPQSRSQAGVSRAHQETVEAALNRLSRGYQTAIECIAAWHRADSSLDIAVMTQVGRAARRAFEEGLLRDPLVMLYAPELSASIGLKYRREPPALTAAAHKDLVKRLAYLSLVNFSDMLISGCGSSFPEGIDRSMLDRGVVQVLKSFGNARASCWNEDEERTVRAALAALLDASTLDQSDPILWVKLACLARRLGRLLDSSGACLPAFLVHRRLEKHALEMGLVSLPTSVPPSRLVQKAAKDWNVEEDPRKCPPMLLEKCTVTAANKTRIVVSRYNSWSTVAKTLLRVVRSGSPQVDPHQHQEASLSRKPVVLGSILDIDIAPIITLPSGIIGFVCAYLTSRDQNSLEATCKELSISVVSVRAAVDHSKTVSTGFDVPFGAEDVVLREKESDSNGDHHAMSPQSNRSSKRLRTQIMTEEKRTERLKRRQSIEYCLRAVVLQCDPESAQCRERLHLRYDWEGEFPAEIHLYLQQAGALTPQCSAFSATSRLQQETRDRLSDSSLYALLSVRWPISSVGMLFRFVSHVSYHLGSVFSSDRGSSTILASALLECVETLLSLSKYKESLTPSWSNGDLRASLDAKLSLLDLFAIDILHGELLLKRVERLESHSFQFDSDGNKVTLLISALQLSCENIAQYLSLNNRMSSDFIRLKARFLWLVTCYFMWRSHVGQVVSESRDAEVQALKRLEECIELLEDTNESVSVPHLDFRQRDKEQCKVLSSSSLKAFRNEVQASSVILVTQEHFLEAVSKLTNGGNGVTVDDMENLAGIGTALLERYTSSTGCWDAKYLEIIEDFVSANNDNLLSGREEMLPRESILDWFDALVPESNVDIDRLQHLADSPSITILSILSTCLVIKKQPAALLDFYGRLIISIGVFCLSKIDRKPQRVPDIKTEDNDFDDNSLENEDDDLREASMIDRLWSYAVLFRLLWAKSQAVLTNEKDDQLQSKFCTSPLLGNMVRISLNLCAKWFQYPRQSRDSVEDSQEDLMMFISVRDFISSINSHCTQSTTLYRDCVLGFANIISTQTLVLLNIVDTKTGHDGRYVRQRLAKMRCDLIAAACCEFGRKLSEASPETGASVPEHWRQSMPQVCESLILLWKTALANELHTKDRLLVPVATAVASLSGFTGTFPSETPSSDKTQSMQEFYDSDGSAADTASDDESSQGIEKKALLQCLGQIIYAINIVFSIIEDNAVASYGYYDAYITEHGPLLPLVISRVLNRIADTLLVKFCDEDDEALRRKAIWFDYPFGTRTIGTLLDTLLHKAYKCLHLFVLTTSNEAKDTTSINSISLKTKHFKPESLDAAASLYRCITRAYSQGRRAPPKIALDTVITALPPLSSEQCGKIDSIRTFLFSTGAHFNLNALETIVNQEKDWELHFQSVDAACHPVTTTENEEDVAVLVRRGISSLLAQGALPETGGDQNLLESVKTEEELAKKFQAILDDLCLGNTRDFRGWYKAAQCLTAKANFIADRIGLRGGFSRSSDFTVPKRPRVSEIGFDLNEMLEQQRLEYESKEKGWISSLGRDLSIFVRCAWSSFSSLESCSAEVGSYYSDTLEGDEDSILQQHIYLELSSFHEKENLAQWQQAWGSLFVSSLRMIATRCLCLAVFFLNQNDEITGDTRGFKSKIMEYLGVSLYTELSGCQSYGYPMHLLTEKRKRNVAQAALTSFSKAMTAIEKDEDQQQAWDLYFMLGKCHEKIASTFRKEKFVSPQGITTTRQYELHMADALCGYSRSLSSALALEKKGQLMSDQEGGSEHGSAEALYRLHATRLKCLIYAVAFKESERELAENEALRLTEAYWFCRPEDYPKGLTIRERVWAVLTDVVDALARCRLGHSYFHRSVYRHAQALLWAPVLSNPTIQWASGSKGDVSASKAAKIRGLNSSDVASSAAMIMNALFEKRRTQLCAVWVTTGSGSPFATLNQAVRKYDSLRGKYIAAYLDTLLLCDNRDTVESFMKLSYAARRDLPSFFAASAVARGAVPRESHSNDTLLQTDQPLSSNFFLTTVKRQANGCLAEMISKDIRSGRTTTSIAKENNLKAAYSCYLRLNSTAESLLKYVRSSKYLRRCDATKAVVVALTEAYVQVKGSSSAFTSGTEADWSNESQQALLLQASLIYCKETFPNLSGSYYSKKPAPKKKRKGSPDVNTESVVQKSFDIKVPEGATAGDSFIVSVDLKGQIKKVRLRVPDPVPTIMRFSLPVSPLHDKDSSTDSNIKRTKT